MDEGYIKFNCDWIPSNDIPLQKVAELNLWRDRMYEEGLVGVYPDGIGFGNIRMRWKENTFLISGSATGGLATLNESHYSLVTNYNLSTNTVTCESPVKALIHQVPTSSENIPCGTSEMADEIKRLFDETTVSTEEIIVMGGHQEGVISFGKDLEEAGNILIEKMKVFL